MFRKTRTALGIGVATVALGSGLLAAAPAAGATNAVSPAGESVRPAVCEAVHIKLSGARFTGEKCTGNGYSMVRGTLTDRAFDGDCAYLNWWWPGGKISGAKACGNEKSEDINTGYSDGGIKLRLSER